MINISFIPSNGRNVYYENSHLNRLVDICLEYIQTDILYNVSLLIRRKSLANRNMFNQFKNSSPDFLSNVYDEIEMVITEIYNDSQVSNLRGAFLELLIFKFLKNKYSLNGESIGLDGLVKINNYISNKTVDVFANCVNVGFVCECKIGFKGFEDHDISNLNEIFNESNEVMIPHIISLSDEEKLFNVLEEIVSQSENSFVNLDEIKIICRNNLDDFFT